MAIHLLLPDPVAQALGRHPQRLGHVLDAPARPDHLHRLTTKLRRIRRATPRHNEHPFADSPRKPSNVHQTGGVPQNYSPTSGGAFDSTTLKTTDPRSLFVGSNYRKAFKVAEQKLGAGAEIQAAVLHPGQLALTVITRGKQLSVAVQYNGEYGSKPGGALAGTPTTFRLTRLAGDTPATLARRIGSETH
jgi:hypothetical protein